MLKRVFAMFFTTVYSLSLQGAYCGIPPNTGATAFYIFPANLRIIEENAFNSTGAEDLVFRSSLISIGEGAFSETRLRDVYIPSTETQIADSAFPLDTGLTIHGTEKGAAHQWAEDHGLSFVPDGGVQSAGGGKAPTPRLGEPRQRAPIFDNKRPLRETRKDRGSERSMRPQDRPELNPIDYKFP